MYLAVHINVDISILQFFQLELMFVFAYKLNVNTLFSFSRLAFTNKITRVLSHFWFLSLLSSH